MQTIRLVSSCVGAALAQKLVERSHAEYLEVVQECV